jgi:ABC-type lipoprotein export system ATPase subunit
MNEQWFFRPLHELLAAHPYALDFCRQLRVELPSLDVTLQQMVARLSDDECEERGIDRALLQEQLEQFIRQMSRAQAGTPVLQSLTLLPGHDKSGQPEATGLTLVPGDIVCIVGPTGSGKSRLLADIECLAQGDTPTGRKILINGEPPVAEQRYAAEHKLVAQLSQNMNFVMDLTVGEFIAMHAESRMISDAEQMVGRIVACANELAGEPFGLEVSVTQLSGGQSRALMIADTALLSPLPIVLIDEIENAGVDRKKALDLLVKEEKIVLMSTHDPLLALLGKKRLVIRNGGISALLATSEREQENLAELEKIDAKLMGLRQRLRTGGAIDFDVRQYFTANAESVVTN